MAAPAAIPAVEQRQWLLTAEGKYKCLLCDNLESFRTKQSFQRHRNDHHRELDLDDDTFKQCQDCRKMFSGAMGLRFHRKGADDRCPEIDIDGEPQAPVAPGNQQGNNINHAVGDAAVLAAARGAAEQERAALVDDLLNSVEEQQQILGLLKEPMYNINSSWKENLYNTIIKLLEGMVSVDRRVTLANTLAFDALPGLIRNTCRNVSTRGRAVDLLKKLVRSPNISHEILIEAKRAVRAMQQEIREPPPPRGSVEHLKTSAETMGQRGRLSAADRIVKQLDQRIGEEAPRVENVQLPTREEAAGILRGLHPQVRSEELDNLSSFEDATLPPGLTVDSDDVKHVIRLSPNDTAPGASGWTTQLMKWAANYGNVAANTNFATLLANVFNRIYDGTMPTECRMIWTRSRSVLIPKGPNMGYRPLGIGGLPYRLLMKLGYSKVTKQLGDVLAPKHQLAVGVPGGCEIGARIVHLHLNRTNLRPDDWRMAPAVISLDVKNCFNTLSTVQTMKGLLEYAPEVTRLFKWTHVDPSDLVWSDGSVICQRMIAYRQGCPGSTPNASLALMPVGDEVLAALRVAEVEFRTEMGLQADPYGPGHYLCFADDGKVLTTLGIAVRFAARLVEIFNRHHLVAVLAKSYIVCYKAEAAHAAGAWPEGWGMQAGGEKAFGVPVGTDEYIDGFLRDKIAQSDRPTRALKRIGKRLATQLTIMCHNTEPAYMLRVIEPRLSMPFAQQHDTWISQAMRAIAEVDDPGPYFEPLLRLPMAMGGAGVYDYRIRLEAGVITSRTRTRAFLQQHMADLLMTAENEDVWAPLALGTANGCPDILGELTAEDRGHLDNLENPKEVDAAARKVVKAVDTKIQLEIIASLNNDGQIGRNQLATLRSYMCKSSGRWLRSTTVFASGQRPFPDA